MSDIIARVINPIGGIFIEREDPEQCPLWGKWERIHPAGDFQCRF
jgi:hypothetical protein